MAKDTQSPEDDGKEPYFFPEYNISVRANSLEEAEILLQQLITDEEVTKA